MSIYLIQPDVNNYRGLLFTDMEKNWELVYCFLDGIQMKKAWIPLMVEPDEDGGPYGDFPVLCSTIPAISGRAANALEPLLSGNAELLPLRCDAGEYYALNVTCVVDALNVEQSEIAHFPDGSIMDIKRFAFHALRAPANDIFKIPQIGTRLFVSERFVQTVEQHQLKGFLFSAVTIVNG